MFQQDTPKKKSGSENHRNLEIVEITSRRETDGVSVDKRTPRIYLGEIPEYCHLSLVRDY